MKIRKGKKKNLLSFVIMCMMAFFIMAGNVYAEEMTAEPAKQGSITLQDVSGNPGKTGAEYAIYQVLQSTETESTNVFTYAWTDAFRDFGNPTTTGYGKTLDEIKKMASGPDDFHFNPDSVDQLTPLLKQYITENSITATKSGVTIGQKAENLPYGYYLILETKTPSGYKASKPVLVEVPKAGAPDVVITVKEQILAIEKKIVCTETDGKEKLVDAVTSQAGKDITFQVTYDVPKYASADDVVFKITDTMEKGLTFGGEESVVVYKNSVEQKNKLTRDTDYSVTVTEGTSANTTTVVYDFSDQGNGKNYYAKVKDAEKVIIRYTGKLNENAHFGDGENITTNVNTVVPTFGENLSSVTDGAPDKTKSYAGAIEITKIDENNSNSPLSGAEFTVYEADENGNIDINKKAQLVVKDVDGQKTLKDAVATSGADGKVLFEGLGEGIYYIKETKSPSGYLLLKEPIKVVVSVTEPVAIVDGNEKATQFTYTITMNNEEILQENNNGVAKINVTNKKGFSLPTTGGKGTYLFTIVGVLFIASGIILFVRSRKKA